MYRPFYALIVLLEALAGSLLLVKSVQSQTPPAGVEGMARSIMIFAWPWDEAVVDEPDGEYGGIDDRPNGGQVPASDASKRDLAAARVPWCAAPAERDAVGQAPGLMLLATGYDGSYDFAMFDGEYREILVDGHEAGGVVEAPASGAEGSQPAPDVQAVYYSLRQAANRMSVVAQDAWRGSWTPYLTLTSPPLGPQLEQLRQAEVARQTNVALQVAASRLTELADAAWQGLTFPFVDLWLTHYSTRIVTDELFGTVQYLHVEIPVQAGQHEEAVLNQAADALDGLSLRLQDMAQQLRHLAVARQTGDGSSPHVARRGK